MSKYEYSLFFRGFFTTLLIFFFLAAFLITDSQNNRYRVGDAARAFELEQTGAFTWNVQALGVGANLNLEPLAKAQSFRRQNACLLIPRFTRTAEQIYALFNQDESPA